MSQSELQQVKASIKQYENLLDGYKMQVCEATFQFSHSVASHCDSMVWMLTTSCGSPNSAQVVKTRAEADEYCVRLAQAEREARTVREEVEQEIEQVRKELLSRLAELEPLPEALQRSQLQLQEAQDRESSQGRQHMELTTTLTDLRMKVTAVLRMKFKLASQNQLSCFLFCFF